MVMAAMLPNGTFETCRHVRSIVAIGVPGKPDVAKKRGHVA